jgi:hypothetical protein
MYSPSRRQRQGSSAGLALALLVAAVLPATGCDAVNNLAQEASGKQETSTSKTGASDKDDAEVKPADCDKDCPCDCKCPEAKQDTPPNQEPYPMVFAGNVKVSEGPLDNDAAEDKVNGQRYSLRECYAPALKKDPTLKGEMDVQFTVSGETGKVIAAIVRQSTINNKPLESCVKEKAQKWTFPRDDKKKKAHESVVKFTVVMLAVSL